MTSPPFPDPGLDDHQLAQELADGAGEVLMRVRADNPDSAPNILKTMGDQSAHRWLAAALASTRPDDAVLSEEATHAEHAAWQAADRSARVWVIDPLDGTREFSEGRSDWAVHVALCNGHVPVAAAVALPAEQLTFSTGNPTAAPPPGERIRIAVSRTRPPAAAQLIASRLDAELVPMGSAGFKAMAVVRGLADVYVHSGGQYEWDNCAPVGVAANYDLWTSRIDGSALRYCNDDPKLPDLLICQRSVAEQVLDILAELE